MSVLYEVRDVMGTVIVFVNVVPLRVRQVVVTVVVGIEVVMVEV